MVWGWGKRRHGLVRVGGFDSIVFWSVGFESGSLVLLLVQAVPDSGWKACLVWCRLISPDPLSGSPLHIHSFTEMRQNSVQPMRCPDQFPDPRTSPSSRNAFDNTLPPLTVLGIIRNSP